jgi:hypothetical protein
MASGLVASDLQDASAYYHFFPISEIRSPHSASDSLRAIGRPTPQSRFYDLGMSADPHAAGKAIRRRQLAFLIRVIGDREAGMRSRLRAEEAV